MNIKRGDVYWVQFDPSVGSEIKKTRPAVVVSADAVNRHLDRFQVVPLSTNTTRLYPGEAIVSIQGSKNKIMGNQITTVSELRIKEFVEQLTGSDLAAVDAALRVQLGL